MLSTDVPCELFQGRYTGLYLLQLACLAVFAITLATLHSARTSEATTIPMLDLGCVASCIGDRRQNNGDLRLLPGQRIDKQGSAPTSARCDDRPTSECVDPENGARSGGGTLPADHYLGAGLFTKSDLEAKVFDVRIQIRDSDLALATRSCANLEDQPNSRGEDCKNVEAGSDYTETVSVLTVAIISVLVLGLIPVGWVMHRSYRLWRMRRRHGTVGKMVRWRVSPVEVQRRRRSRRFG